MASTRLVASVMIMFILLQGSSANDHRGGIGTGRKLLKDTKTMTDLFRQRGDANGSKILGGRKMVIDAGEKSGDEELATPKRFFEDLKKDTSRTNKDNGAKIDDSVIGLEAQADEVAKLMRRDYRGESKKPPIHNQEPNN